MGGSVMLMIMIGLQIHYTVLAILTKAAFSDGLSPTIYVMYRQGIATLALAPFIFLSNKRRRSLTTSVGLKGFFWMFMTSLFGVTVNQNAYFSGLFYASSTAATAMTNLIPALTFVFAAILGFEKIDLRSLGSVAKILGTICCVSGALTMAFLKGNKLLHMDSIGLTASEDDNWILGCLLLLASSVFWSCWMIMQVPISSYCPDHVFSTFWMCLFATIQSTIMAVIQEHDLQAWILHSTLGISCCLYSGIGIAISFFIQSWCISQRGPLYCVMFNPLAAVFTALVAATFLHEQLYVGSLVGAIGVIVGLYIVLWGKAKDFDGTKQEQPQSKMEDGERSNRIDLEEPLVAEKSEYVAEIKMEGSESLALRLKK
ncbi:WAT1-related protein At4g28040 [Lathyrus oleraceus]|uniref:WAT1-related protein At4g28040 n=1 Tax=Pisum sativum TaxID=3888 RepID=UPI0021CDEEFB|nr:WAT1-related protein At4g28040-like [Pisum sativum]